MSDTNERALVDAVRAYVDWASGEGQPADSEGRWNAMVLALARAEAVAPSKEERRDDAGELHDE